ncbi:MAG: ABC transporter ATP-binding protein, partial [Bacteroidota bacterium]|nr:ABC transporter ATP-binding protein [Bacteroidota bacterium]
YILVSHDRYFVNQTCNKIWEIEEYKIKEFVGNFEEWEEWKQRSAEKLKKVDKLSNEKSVLTKSEIKAEKPAAKIVIDKDSKKELQKIQRHFQQIEEKIATLTKQKVELESALSSHEIYTNNAKFLQTETDYKNVSDHLQKVNAEYEIVFEKMMELEGK